MFFVFMGCLLQLLPRQSIRQKSSGERSLSSTRLTGTIVLTWLMSLRTLGSKSRKKKKKKKRGEIAAATQRYVGSQAVFKQMQACANRMAGRECQYQRSIPGVLYLFSAAKSLDLTERRIQYPTHLIPIMYQASLREQGTYERVKLVENPYLAIGMSFGWLNLLWKEIKRFL